MSRVWKLAVPILLFTTACANTTTPATQDPSVLPATLAHVHGLGIDPADGMLYAASHFGVFTVPADKPPERVGDRKQDTMGFVVVGANHFLGSGHPDRPEPGTAPHLGLIESKDAGRTWQTLSLAGAADFHSLEVKHNRVYGYNSQNGQIMISENQRDWDTRSRVSMVDFTISPTDPDVILAATQQGVVRSTDGGRTFAAAGGSPRLTLLDWSEGDIVIGVASDGIVHVSEDSAASWTARGRIAGTPAALAAKGSEVYIATESAIHASIDSGSTFTIRQALK
ncbi:exo-alpha-sialidase [Lentzea sp. BCCO 10_0856]|uniref:Exo-alpha-sialidase n=1 Tax=Lentzea miocenica TaxID=3095431 RepID=A0ABU4T9I2_9PSEU|nr:exo-alpha-sialidase [Lentzea sp. BCCO 10_0856]MDX8034833.1 exo-alpha-sialidase [Lentzea sp. BCCO 10_0856]